MKLTPSSTARRSTATGASRSSGQPQTPLPVSCIVPKPRRVTVRLAPMVKVPDAAAGSAFAESVMPPVNSGRRIRVPDACSLCAHRGQTEGMKITDTSDLWWKNAVVYCLDVETYLDWNGDGVGDFV